MLIMLTSMDALIRLADQAHIAMVIVVTAVSIICGEIVRSNEEGLFIMVGKGARLFGSHGFGFVTRRAT